MSVRRKEASSRKDKGKQSADCFPIYLVREKKLKPLLALLSLWNGLCLKLKEIVLGCFT